MPRIPPSQYYIPSKNLILNNFWEARQQFPNVSIPEGVDLPELGLYVLNLTLFPEEIPAQGKYWAPGNPVTDGLKWYQGWDQLDLPPQEFDQAPEDPVTE